MLVFSKTQEFRHDNIEGGIEALEAHAARSGIALDATEDASQIREEHLGLYRAVVFFNTTGDVLDADQQLALERYIQAGGSYVGIHSAADTEWKGNEWPWYTRLVGAAFSSHPMEPSNVQEARLDVVDRSHPATSHLTDTWVRSDEWYDYQRLNPNVTPLLTVDEATYQGGKSGEPHVISWFHEFDGGRSFYTGLGHTEESFEEKAFLDHVLGGLRWAMGDGNGPPDLDYAKTRPEDWRIIPEVLATEIGEPMAMAFTPSGALYVVERDGAVHRWDEASGKLHHVEQLDAHTGTEHGLLGIVFDPAHDENGWVYLYWVPEPGETEDLAYRLARYELRDDVLDLESETVLLEIPVDPGSTSHEGGTLIFDADGNLWLSTGDDTNPHESDGYAPLDARPDRTIFDASRSAASTQDLRGKILRLRPRADGTYDVPEGNLFDNADQGRPEIYAMGVRNPFRFTVDSETGTLYWGDVGPDARDDSETRGPRGYDEFNRTTRPGNFGWPYVIGDNIPYRAFDWATETSGAPFDAEAPKNTSGRRTGLVDLPPATPAWIAYSYDSTGELYDLADDGDESSRTAMVGPVVRRAGFADPDAEGALPAYYDGKLVIYEFMRDWVKLVSTDEQGRILKIEPFPIDLALSAPMDVKLGPDGKLYVLEYGATWFQDNDDSRLSRHSYFAGANPLPSARATVTPTLGAPPLTMTLDGTASFDRNPDDELSYEWVLKRSDGSSTAVATGSETTATIDRPGAFEIELRVTDTAGGVSSATMPVVVGNEPPDVQIQAQANQSFFFEDDGGFDYAIVVTDAEDGSTASGDIRPEDVTVTIDFVDADSPRLETYRDATALGSLDPAREAMQAFGCWSCHQVDVDSSGPALEKVAQRYEPGAETVNRLATKVIEGGGGEWGERSMPAQPYVDRESAVQIVRYILGGGAPESETASLRGRIAYDRHTGTTSSGGDADEDAAALAPANGRYVLSATYLDRGAADSEPIAVRRSISLRAPYAEVASADELSGAMPIEITKEMQESIPEVARGYLPEIPEGFEFLIGQNGGQALFRDLDLTGINRIELRSTAWSFFAAGGAVDVRLDAPDGPVVGSADIPSTLLPEVAADEVEIGTVEGRHDLYLSFRGDGEKGEPLFMLVTIEFKRA